MLCSPLKFSLSKWYIFSYPFGVCVASWILKPKSNLVSILSGTTVWIQVNVQKYSHLWNWSQSASATVCQSQTTLQSQYFIKDKGIFLADVNVSSFSLSSSPSFLFFSSSISLFFFSSFFPTPSSFSFSFVGFILFLLVWLWQWLLMPPQKVGRYYLHGFIVWVLCILESKMMKQSLSGTVSNAVLMSKEKEHKSCGKNALTFKTSTWMWYESHLLIGKWPKPGKCSCSMAMGQEFILLPQRAS